MDSEQRCACALEEGANLEEVRDELRGRVHSGWARAVLGLLLLAAGIASMALEFPLIWVGGTVGGVAMSIRGVRVARGARARLRELDAYQLPAARVVREP